MALFKPQLKRDAVPRAEGEWEQHTAERNLGNGLAGEPMAAKQAATSLYASPSLEQLPLPITTPPGDGAAPDKASPTAPSSTPSSARKSGTTNKDPIPIEEEGSSDSELEVVEAPPAKKAKTIAPTNNTAAAAAARPTTGGKAPAKRTGGKSVARKATGGKNVARKGTGGKAPKKR